MLPLRQGRPSSLAAPACAAFLSPLALLTPSYAAGLQTYEFKHSTKDANVYWDVRKGLIPIVGAAREAGTSMLLEDVACPVDK